MSTLPRQSTDNIIHRGEFRTGMEHGLNSGVIETAIQGWESSAINIALGIINDADVRVKYAAHIKSISKEVRNSVVAGTMTVKEGAEFCNMMRDKLVIEYRAYTSAFGVASTELIKAKARGLDFYLNKYAQNSFRKDFLQLSAGERKAVYFEVILAAGRDNATVTKGIKELRSKGTMMLLLTGTLIVGEIINAKDRIREMVRQGSIVAGGIVGGTAGASLSFLCGPAEPACIGALMILGSDVGSKAGLKAYEVYSEEWQHFQEWMRN
ncbi:hypothetical protein [Caballeronia sp. J97]|uniref:hypothetical protein n=1 Tax=Caballeronia sp. J97 TaxID=2805429 RepID=UPI002AB2EF7D|nr:hypothetical protein [Caballeronia sp. J97]